jgi:hypothetical protein
MTAKNKFYFPCFRFLTSFGLMVGSKLEKSQEIIRYLVKDSAWGSSALLSPLALDLSEVVEDKWNIALINLQNCSWVFRLF